MKTKDFKWVYLWIDHITGVAETYVSRLKLSESRNIPYYTLNYRFGRLKLRRFSLNKHQEVRKVPQYI